MISVKISYGGETVTMTWDGVQASAPILVDGEPTPYQTATARHRTELAVALACRHVWPEVQWPEVPAVGSIGDDWADGNDAWDEVEYETVGDQIHEAQLYWDDQDPKNAGWWLRWCDERGEEQGTAIEASEDATTEELASAVESESHWIGEGKIKIIRGEQARGSITIRDGEVTWDATR